MRKDLIAEANNADEGPDRSAQREKIRQSE
jgi:hypothetical protein